MELPVELLNALKNVKGFDREAFEKIHASGEQVTSIRVNPAKWIIGETSEKIMNVRPEAPLATSYSPLATQIPWTQFGYYLPDRPSFTFDPLFHAGCYYVQEASSMFLEQAVKQTLDLSKPVKVLDLCAAPGGKSTHLQSLLSKESLLVSNELIRSRVNILKDNIIKWGAGNVMVTRNDPADFSGMDNFFDMIVIDAPCSGSGLFRRDEGAIDEWSENNVRLCSQRQQRILSDILPALKKNGILVYATCSYSQQEDEDIVKWMQEDFPLEYCPLAIEPGWGIIETGNGYRFWPDKVKGEGFFLAVLRKQSGEEYPSIRVKKKQLPLSGKETELLKDWIMTEELFFIKHKNTVYAWPEARVPELDFLLERLNVIYSGVLAGELIREKLVPAHALAMSLITSSSVGGIELSKEETIRYLQRKDIQSSSAEKGWQMVCFNGLSLGWVNILSNRVNNYYPRELRILKDSIDS